MARIKMVIEYDGSEYHGFQMQNNAETVQEELEKGIRKLTGAETRLICAGRTDAGVHALGQVIAFDSCASIPAERWGMALNSVLPEDIRVRFSALAADDFNPRFHALRKTYSYLIYRKKERALFYRRYALCSTENLNIISMRQACDYLLGRHNFSAFCASGNSSKTFEREVYACSLESTEKRLIFKITANGFLYNMVRIIVGTLLEIGRGKYQPEHMERLIIARDRTRAGPTAPPQGLYLHEVEY
ncbi:MAG: tRNA pseudouridine(38-40) synthase TruA [Syntrophomonadaceae bacterium]|jgi:tRNA pseudouridine38-40 synthase|nr:tRNA pseudouridine(38-40) synthase TruA [Syntrophomonadaceae bacterium]